MNKNEYMKILSHELRRLPKEDYGRAIEYFEEYFAEAGPENEAQAIEDLGSPQEAAKALIMDLAAQNADQPPKTVKRGLSAVWIGILGVCASPIVLPLALVLVIVTAVLGITALAVVLSLVIAAASIVTGAVLSVVGGGVLLFTSFADGLCNIGFGLFFLGAGILLTWGAVALFRWIIRKLSVLLGRITKGGRQNEAQK